MLLGWWAFALCALLLAALLVVVAVDRLDANSLLVRWGIALAAVTGLLASVAQIIGRSLRNPFDGEG